ncbi:MAG: hypothetical protein J0M18_12980 [Ignavibacteria bacterium]|nr:hypothetical protein [Ignavibacteria bacterium]
MKKLLFAIIFISFTLASCGKNQKFLLTQLTTEKKIENQNLNKFKLADSSIQFVKTISLKCDSTIFSQIVNFEILTDDIICVSTYEENSKTGLFNLKGDLLRLLHLSKDFNITSSIIQPFGNKILIYDNELKAYYEFTKEGELSKSINVKSSYSNMTKSDQAIFFRVTYDPYEEDPLTTDKLDIYDNTLNKVGEIEMPYVNNYFVTEILPINSFHMLTVRDNLFYVSSINFKLIKYNLSEKRFMSTSNYSFPNVVITEFNNNIELDKKFEVMKKSSIVEKLTNINNEVIGLHSNDSLYFFDLNCNYISSKKIGFGLLAYSKNHFYLLKQPYILDKKYIYPEVTIFKLKNEI